ncbi:uncharacterized protein METZ01_LOCUS364588, partial [marine metagenome]
MEVTNKTKAGLHYFASASPISISDKSEIIR